MHANNFTAAGAALPTLNIVVFCRKCFSNLRGELSTTERQDRAAVSLIPPVFQREVREPHWSLAGMAATIQVPMMGSARADGWRDVSQGQKNVVQSEAGCCPLETP